ncbi:MAG: hypothetical protein LBR32_05605, partial [Propionibacteriaceae bacterium]|nr:hypothetical protein [Propionibacteriaceae bacterium]
LPAKTASASPAEADQGADALADSPATDQTASPTPTRTATPKPADEDRWVEIATWGVGGLIGAMMLFFIVGALLRRRVRSRR